MTWCNNNDVQTPAAAAAPSVGRRLNSSLIKTCPSCGHRIHLQEHHQGGGIQELPGLPAGVKFDPTDQELLEHLEGKTRPELQRFHPLVDDFIPTIEGEDGICYTHPQKLPGVSRDGIVRHFFHRPSKAYTTGTRKRRKVLNDQHGCETRWHKTGKTRPVLVGGNLKGYKKILVLYTNYGKQRKPEKTNWVMHQYHLGSEEEEKEGELVVSKVFYQTQPRQCGAGGANRSHALFQTSSLSSAGDDRGSGISNNICCNSSVIGSYNQRRREENGPTHLVPKFSVHSSSDPSRLP
ncbi:NAC domain-containing protein 73-like [Zingiber officinale]|uniref:NAC domain-containing protein n=1 Tax=Zingiber officinale TaxID=94328 RepID=A0A8J5C7X6_ZINOF|nr:NAC domain-containing protein 73-like [Zingiber officinale]XP_042442262.1 NAC domain-containing protein 73-like [Zingiber officinale]KAG6473055.1 hypothetical protein ZIOFF_066962 [Zingiber officinale]